MADLHNKKNEQEGKETVEFFKDLDKEALNIESFLEKNARALSIGFGVLIFRRKICCESWFHRNLRRIWQHKGRKTFCIQRWSYRVQKRKLPESLRSVR